MSVRLPADETASSYSQMMICMSGSAPRVHTTFCADGLIGTWSTKARELPYVAACRRATEDEDATWQTVSGLTISRLP